jgi:uncharacterized membrane protein
MRWRPVTVAPILLALGCASAGPDLPALRVFGNEPFWNVVIQTGDEIVYTRLGEGPVAFAYEAPRIASGDLEIWVYGPIDTADGGSEIEIRISHLECPDTMADTVHPMRATVTVDGEELTGCARRLDDPAPESP